MTLYGFYVSFSGESGTPINNVYALSPRPEERPSLLRCSGRTRKARSRNCAGWHSGRTETST